MPKNERHKFNELPSGLAWLPYVWFTILGGVGVFLSAGNYAFTFLFWGLNNLAGSHSVLRFLEQLLDCC